MTFTPRSSSPPLRSPEQLRGDPEPRVITVRYWAGARAAAGVAADEITVDAPLTLAEVRRQAVERHADTRLGDVLAVCSVLIGDRPVGREDPDSVEVPPGASVEFLPPFAGG